MPAPSPPTGGETRCGTISIVGKPNVGKSTLLNVLVGEPLSIVSRKPQATRRPVVGLRTDGNTQIVFHDQPGLLHPKSALHRAMREAALESVRAADAVLFLVKLGAPWRPMSEVEPVFSALTVPVAHVLTHGERGGGCTPAPSIPDPLFVVSGKTGAGVPVLLDWCRDQMPPGPFRHDADDISTQPTRFFAEEFVREAAFEVLSDELPYALVTELDEFREGSFPLYIRITLYVERETQKRMVIGRGGSTLRRLGMIARRRTEALLGQQVYLDLWVKVLPKWRSKPSLLSRFGLPLSPGNEQ